MRPEVAKRHVSDVWFLRQCWRRRERSERRGASRAGGRAGRLEADLVIAFDKELGFP